MQMRMIVNHFSRAASAARVAVVILVFSLASATARAEVLNATATGFVVEHVATASGSPTEAWNRLVEPAAWWHPDHTWSADAAGLSLDPTAGGCFCETLAAGGSVEHLRVVHAAPGRMLRMDGRLGPLQAMPVNGVLTFSLAGTEDGGTEIKLNYAVAGSGLENWAAAVDGVLGQQIQRLAADDDAGSATD